MRQRVGCKKAADAGDAVEPSQSPAATAPPKGELFAVTETYWMNDKSLRQCYKLPPERKDFPRPGEDVTAGDKRGNLASRSDD